jgi:hypothetical protein
MVQQGPKRILSTRGRMQQTENKQKRRGPTSQVTIFLKVKYLFLVPWQPRVSTKAQKMAEDSV